MAKKPNILFILSDDHGNWAFHAAGNQELITPNLDRLSNEGTRFEDFFCASPVCSPARLSIFTGEIPSQHGVHDWIANGHIDHNDLSDELKQAFANNDPAWEYQWPKDQLNGDTAIRFLDGHTTFTQVLAQNGYQCGISGKWHMGDSNTPQAGFSYWRTLAMGGDNYKYPVVRQDGKMTLLRDRYVTDYITDNALDFLDQTTKDQPFYLSVHYTAPHAPWDERHHPADIWALYNDCKFESVPSLPPHEWSGVSYASEEERLAKRRNNLQGYFTAITAMDRGIGRILDKLDEQGIADDTLVIFTGDNGMSMGHHGVFGKGNATYPMNMWDTAVKIPMLFRFPNHVPAGQVNTQMFSHYDLFPTLLDYLGMDCPADTARPGHSFAPILQGESMDGQTSVVVLDEYGPVRMIRTCEWKYIHRYGKLEGMNELYHLTTDPDELHNLIDDPATIPLQKELYAQLEAWFAQYVDPRYDGTKQPVMGSGQTARVYPNPNHTCNFRQK